MAGPLQKIPGLGSSTSPVRRSLRKLRLRRLLVLGIGQRHPVSMDWGYERGTPIDRIYIHRFLEANAGDIKGTVLEIGDPGYTRRYGGDKVTNSEVLHAVEGNPEATFVGNLETGENVPKDRYDCIILTETLTTMYDVHTAVRNTYDALRPGGVVLVTVNNIGPIDREGRAKWGDYWRFTDKAAERLFADVFGAENVTAGHHGNVLTACAFLYGFAAEEMRAKDFEYEDVDYQIIATIRARKPTA